MKNNETSFSKPLKEALHMAGLDVLKVKTQGKKSVWTVGRLPVTASEPCAAKTTSAVRQAEMAN